MDEAGKDEAAKDNLIESLSARLTEGLRSLAPDRTAEELRRRIDPLLESVFTRFELVPKQEFERQVELLERLEDEVARLERRLETLEAERETTGDEPAS